MTNFYLKKNEQNFTVSKVGLKCSSFFLIPWTTWLPNIVTESPLYVWGLVGITLYSTLESYTLKSDFVVFGNVCHKTRVTVINMLRQVLKSFSPSTGPHTLQWEMRSHRVKSSHLHYYEQIKAISVFPMGLSNFAGSC